MTYALRVGDIELAWLDGGTFMLDGGTMFGAVPRSLWSRRLPHDGDNLVRLTNSPMVATTPGGVVVVDTGLGNKLTEKQRSIYCVSGGWDLPGGLSRLGLSREDVGFVILTHLDFDHSGGVLTMEKDGRTALTFPNARHIVQRAEWEDATNPNDRAKSAYWPVNTEGLERSGLLEIVDGPAGITPGIRVELTGGHTRGHQVVWVESAGKCVLHMADLLPTHAHFNPLWVTAYDNFPLDAIDSKKRLEAEAIEKDAWFAFYHDPGIAACKFDTEGNVRDKIKLEL